MEPFQFIPAAMQQAGKKTVSQRISQLNLHTYAHPTVNNITKQLQYKQSDQQQSRPRQTTRNRLRSNIYHIFRHPDKGQGKQYGQYSQRTAHQNRPTLSGRNSPQIADFIFQILPCKSRYQVVFHHSIFIIVYTMPANTGGKAPASPNNKNTRATTHRRRHTFCLSVSRQSPSLQLAQELFPRFVADCRRLAI